MEYMRKIVDKVLGAYTLQNIQSTGCANAIAIAMAIAIAIAMAMAMAIGIEIASQPNRKL